MDSCCSFIRNKKAVKGLKFFFQPLIYYTIVKIRYKAFQHAQLASLSISLSQIQNSWTVVNWFQKAPHRPRMLETKSSISMVILSLLFS